jgi:hypothetical protein
MARIVIADNHGLGKQIALMRKITAFLKFNMALSKGS